jgi:hypothetical protein
MNRYTVGAQVVVKGTFTNSNGTIDPTNASVDIVTPSEITTTYTYLAAQVTRVSAGIYTFTIDTTGQPGRWSYRWWSPPTPIGAANQGEFIVDPFPPEHI